jgi:hypothetical protein
MFSPEKYRSVTWLKGGRVYPQLDCFGIINEIRKDLDLPLWPDFAGVTKDGGGLDREAEIHEIAHVLRTCLGAGVACYSGSTVTHVGIVVQLDNQLQVAECNPERTSLLPLARFVRRFNRVEFWQ